MKKFKPLTSGGATFRDLVVIVDGVPYALFNKRQHNERGQAYDELHLVPFEPEEGK